MKAWVLHDIGDIRYEECADPVPEKDEVLLEVLACGICGSDIPRIYTTGAHNMPLIPGHEFAGRVLATGADVDPSWNKKRAAVFPLIPCMKCENCLHGLYEMCSNYDYLGSRKNGAFAPLVAVPARCLFEIPEGVTMRAVAMLEPMAVAVHALRAGLSALGTDDPALLKEKSVAVYGAGTIGLLLVMFLCEAGCEKLFVIGNKDFQKEQAVSLGVDEGFFCDVRDNDPLAFVRERTGQRGADLVFECVGSSAVVGGSIALSAPAGAVVTVGNPHGDISLSRDIYWQILRRQLTIRGVWNSSFTGKEDDDWHYAASRLAQGKIRPERLITHHLTREGLETGLHIMRDKTEPYIKIMIDDE